jgi:hypothetical protein
MTQHLYAMPTSLQQSFLRRAQFVVVSSVGGKDSPPRDSRQTRPRRELRFYEYREGSEASFSLPQAMFELEYRWHMAHRPLATLITTALPGKYSNDLSY